MKYGVREICEVVLRAKGTMKVGKKTFYKDEPVLYFDTLKTSSFEGSSTTVYAQGGRGNARLMSWDGDKTTTFTMEDALISPEGLMILAGAELLQASSSKPIYQHVTETISASDTTKVTYGNTTTGSKRSIASLVLSNTPVVVKNGSNKVSADTIYVMLMKNGEIVSEPYIGTLTDATGNKTIKVDDIAKADRMLDADGEAYSVATAMATGDFDAILVDYYVERQNDKVMQINITPDSFGGAFYLEASTLFRNEDGIDVPAEFIIPNCRVQSNFSFSMAATGDPSTFTFTLDCFPDYTKWDPTEKVLAVIQVVPSDASAQEFRAQTNTYEPAG